MSTELITKLIEAGTPAALVAEVAMELARAEAATETLEGRKAKDRQRKRLPRKSEESTEGAEIRDTPPCGSPKDIYQTPSSPPAPKTEAKASAKSLVEQEKLEAIGTCLRAAFPPPDGVTDEQWDAFRGQRRKKLNARSYTLLTNKLLKLAEDGWPPGDMIDLATERGWETVFAPRNHHGQSPGNVTSLRGTRPDPALDLLRAARAAEDREDNWRAGPSLPALGSG